MTLKIIFVALYTTQLAALTVNDNWERESQTSISKNDILNIVTRVGSTKVNGRKFDIADVQDYFDDIKPGDYKKYWERQHKFERDYGTSNLAQLLFRLAMGDNNIKKYEKRFKITIDPNQQVLFEDYRFITPALKDIYNRATDHSFENSCVVTFTKGDSATECRYDKGSSGLLGLSIFILTNGNLGDTHGARREKTICESGTIINALVRTRNAQGEEMLSHVSYKAHGTSIIYDENVWFRGDMKKSARARAQLDYSNAEDLLEQYKCDHHRPWDNIRSTLEFPRIEQEQMNESDAVNHDMADSMLEPGIQNTERDSDGPIISNNPPLPQATNHDVGDISNR